MSKKTERFELRLSEASRQALEKIAEHDGLTMSGWVNNQIHKHAKRKKVWHDIKAMDGANQAD